MKVKRRSWLCWLLGMSLAVPVIQAESDRIGEGDYAAAFDRVIVPFWNAGTRMPLTGTGGVHLNAWYQIHPKARGQVLISHGYSESSLKYRELAYNFFARGYSVFFLDHRGHGFSDRLNAERDSVDVADFADYSEDFRRFYAAMPLDKTVPVFIFAHSMGGAIAIDFLEKNPNVVQGAAFSAPLFEPQMRGLPVFMARAFSRLLGAYDEPDRFTLRRNHDSMESWTLDEAGTRSEARFEHYKKIALEHKLRLVGPTNRWVITMLNQGPLNLDDARVAKLQIPLFIGVAGQDRIVQPEPIRAFCLKAPHCSLQDFPEGYHELWNERDAIRNAFLDRVFEFFQSLEKKS